MLDDSSTAEPLSKSPLSLLLPFSRSPGQTRSLKSAGMSTLMAISTYPGRGSFRGPYLIRTSCTPCCFLGGMVVGRQVQSLGMVSGQTRLVGENIGRPTNTRRTTNEAKSSPKINTAPSRQITTVVSIPVSRYLCIATCTAHTYNNQH